MVLPPTQRRVGAWILVILENVLSRKKQILYKFAEIDSLAGESNSFSASSEIKKFLFIRDLKIKISLLKFTALGASEIATFLRKHFETFLVCTF